MQRCFPLLTFLLIVLSPAPAQADFPAVPYGIELTVSVPGRPSFPRNGLAEVGVSLKNVSQHDVRLALSSCPHSSFDVEELDTSGHVVYPPVLANMPASDCAAATPGPPIHPGHSVGGGGYAVLRTNRLRPLALLWVSGKPVVVRGRVITVPMYTGRPIGAALHTTPALYADVRPFNRSFGLTYKYWYTCLTSAGARISEVHPRESLSWLYGQRSFLHPRFRSDCTRVQEWHAIAGYLFEPVVTIHDTQVHILSPPAPVVSTLGTPTPRRQIVHAFQLLAATPRFQATGSTRYRLSPQSNLGTFATETGVLIYNAPDRLRSTTHGLSPVAKPQTLTFLQVGPNICDQEPYNYPPNSWRSYPYDLFSYHNHRPDAGLTFLQGLGLPVSIEQKPRSWPSGFTGTFSRSATSTVVGGKPQPTTAIRMHFRYPVQPPLGSNGPPFEVVYRGITYRPQTGDQHATLLIDTSTGLPLRFTSTSTVTISTGTHIVVERRNGNYSYTGISPVELPTQQCG